MTKFAEVPYQARHTGKSGYISPSPRGSPKPFPYGVAEEFGANLYPYYKDFIPKDFRNYADSYIDLRNKPYKVWYDKWGKPHINKWWRKQLDETLRIKKAYENFQKNGKYSYPRSKFHKRDYSKRHSPSYSYCKSINFRSRICQLKYRSTRQRPNRKRWTPRWKTKFRYKYKKYY